MYHASASKTFPTNILARETHDFYRLRVLAKSGQNGQRINCLMHLTASRGEVDAQLQKESSTHFLRRQQSSSFSLKLHASKLYLLQNHCHRHSCLQSPKTPGLTAHLQLQSTIYNLPLPAHLRLTKRPTERSFIFIRILGFPMLLVQNPASLTHQPDTMAGYNPQKLPRTQQAAARYISFFPMSLLSAFYRDTHVVRIFVFECNCNNIHGFHFLPKDTPQANPLPRLGPAGFHYRVPVTCTWPWPGDQMIPRD